MIADILSDHVKLSGRERNHLRGHIRKHPRYRAWCQRKHYRSGGLTKKQIIEAYVDLDMVPYLELILYHVGVA